MGKRFLTLLLAAALLLSCLSATAWASAEEGISSILTETAESEGESMADMTDSPNFDADSVVITAFDTLVDPVYELETSLTAVTQNASSLYTSVSNAGSYLRQQMVLRNGYYDSDDTETEYDGISIGLQYRSERLSSPESLIYEVADLLLDEAYAYTGAAEEGDYLYWQFGSYTYQVSYSYSTANAAYVMYFTFYFEYYTTAEQEEEVDAAVEEVLAELELDGKSDYQTALAIYDYICTNVTYDYDNLYDSDYLLKHTAYAALINGTAVCQGYALLFYRLALEAGLNARIIDGTSSGQHHGWNIVELDDQYYFVDATWDAGLVIYQYFLKGTSDFEDHDYGEDYSTTYTCSILDSCTISETAYEGSDDSDEETVASGECGTDMIWTLTTDGTLTIYGNGSMTSFRERTAPWYEYRDLITSVVVKSAELTGVTSIGSCAFYGCTNLVDITLPDTLTEIGSSAFSGCTSLTAIYFSGDAPSIHPNAFHGVTATAYYPYYNDSWTSDVRRNYGGTLTWEVRTSTLSFYDSTDLLEELTVYYGATVDVDSLFSASLTLTGYTFAGWADADGNSVTGTFTITGDTALYTVWTANTYTLSLYDGEELLSSTEISYGETISLDALLVPSADGYTFAGWADADGSPVTGDLTVTGDLALYALWSVSIYTLSLYDGDALLSSTEISYGETISLDTLPVPSADGYTFAGWTDADGNPVTGDLTVTGDLALYASWTEADTSDETGESTETDNAADEEASNQTDETSEGNTSGEESAENFTFTDDDGTGSWIWASDAIYALYDCGIVSGYAVDDGYAYQADSNLSRAEAAKFIALAYNLDVEETNAESLFSDVSDSHWAVSYINACYEAGIVEGRDTGGFDADAYLTRAEMATMIVRAAALTVIEDAEVSFTDTAGHWASDYIETCVSEGLVQGVGDGKYEPDSNITRAQMAVLIARALGLVESASDE